MGAVFVVSEQANRELEAMAAHLKADLGKAIYRNGVWTMLTAAEAQRVYIERMRAILGHGGYREVPDNRTVRVKCDGCGRVEQIIADVTRYRCRCNPHVERFTCKTTVVGE
jgi:hypothetical protein